MVIRGTPTVFLARSERDLSLIFFINGYQINSTEGFEAVEMKALKLLNEF